MSRIRSRDTGPEKIVRSALHRLGFRFRLHNANLPGTPDIVMPKYKIVIFVHGCFWHRHENCKQAYTPKTRIDFWQKKFQVNIEHDRVVMKQLRESDWNPVVIWECQTENPEKLNIILENLTSTWKKAR